MTDTDSGRLAEATGLSSASPIEPVPVSPVPASIPSAFILVRQTGSYSDFRENPVRAYLEEEAANEACGTAIAEWQSATAGWKEINYPDDPAPDDDPRWEAWEIAQNVENEKFKASLSIDPNAAPNSPWLGPDDASYVVWAVPLAQAIEARRAETGTGSVHESAVLKGCVHPAPASPTPSEEEAG